MNRDAASIVKQRQDPLRERYRRAAEEACITDGARTIDDRADPFHGTVALGERHGSPWRFGIHRAVGGYHDLPNPGDMLCAALAGCLDSTIRMVADRLGIDLEILEVAVSAEADMRGALLVDRTVPVGFQGMNCNVRVRPARDADPTKLQVLLAAAEHSCVVLQTLRHGVPMRMGVDASPDEVAAPFRPGRHDSTATSMPVPTPAPTQGRHHSKTGHGAPSAQQSGRRRSKSTTA